MEAEPTVARRRARAMGTDLAVTVVVDPSASDPSLAGDLAAAAVSRVRELESLWSRFDAGSEVSRLNAAGGEPRPVSTETRQLLEVSVEAWRIGGGFVDCTQLAALEAAGYDRTFEALADNRAAAPRNVRPGSARLPDWQFCPADIEIGSDWAALPHGIGFDPGGIGKGLAADMVTAEIMESGCCGVCIDVGGDLRVRGMGPRGGPWTISVDHPHSAQPLALIGMADGAVASSTTLKRTWVSGGERRHHLMDPRTGEPSRSGIEFSTALADTAWRAETMAKAMLLRGGPHHFDLIDGSGIEALMVDEDGNVITSPGIERFTGGVEPRTTVVRDVPTDGRGPRDRRDEPQWAPS